MRKLQNLFLALAALCFAIPAFADGGSAVIDMAPIGVGLGMALARNPGTRAGLMTFLVIGLAFIESLTLFTFAMIFLKIK
jgi:F-type H+-transporting ATPase subunit c